MEAERLFTDRRRAERPKHSYAGRQLVLPGMAEPGPREAIKWAGVAALFAAGLTAFWLLPFLAHQALGGASTGWATPRFAFRLGEVLDGRLLFRPPVGWLLLASMVVALAVRQGHRPTAMVLAPVAYLLVAHLVKERFPFNGLAFQLPNRGLGYAGCLAVLSLAVTIDHSARRLTPRAAVGVATAAALAVGVWPVASLSRMSRGSHPLPVAIEAAGEVRRLVPAHARFAVERQPFERDATGLGSPPFWFALSSQRHVVNAFAPETSTAPIPMFVGDSMTEVAPPEAADRLAQYGVTHILLTAPASAERFAASPRFRREWSRDRLSIFSVLASPERPDPSSQVSTDGPAEAKLLRGEPERLQVRVTAAAAVTATFAVARSPKWSARLDGRAVSLESTDLGLLRLSIPAGTHTVDLAFHRDRWDALGATVTAVTVAIALLAAVRHRRAHQGDRQRPRRIRGPSPPSPSVQGTPERARLMMRSR